METKTTHLPVSTLVLAALLILGTVGVGIGLLLSNRPPDADAPTRAADVQSGGVDDYTGIAIDPPAAVQDFTLTDVNGEPFSFSALQGRVVVLYFGFTRCPDFCPTTLLEFRTIKRALGDAAAQTAFVFISVDGERDTPDYLKTYIARFDTDFIGLTGDPETVREIAAQFNATFTRVPLDNGNYTMDHTVTTFLIDPQGRWVRRFSFGTPPDTIATFVRQLAVAE